MRKTIVISLALIILTLPAAARTQKIMTYQESANGERRAELKVQTEESSIIAGCRSSSQTPGYKVYYLKSDKKGNRLCVENSVQDAAASGHYLQKNADGSALLASYMTSPAGASQALFMLKDAAGEEIVIWDLAASPLVRRLLSLDHEMKIYLKDIQKYMR